MVIRHIYLYCMDTVSRDARFGVGGTSKLAVRLMGNWLSSYKMKQFSVTTKFLDKKGSAWKQMIKFILVLKKGELCYAICS
jgi:hypothetical protein